MSTQPLIKTLGEVLADLRGDRLQDAVVADLAAHGVTVKRQSLSHWEQDRVTPGPAALIALAKVYGADVSDLLAAAAVPFEARARRDGKPAGMENRGQQAVA